MNLHGVETIETMRLWIFYIGFDIIIPSKIFVFHLKSIFIFLELLILRTQNEKLPAQIHSKATKIQPVREEFNALTHRNSSTERMNSSINEKKLKNTTISTFDITKLLMKINLFQLRNPLQLH